MDNHHHRVHNLLRSLPENQENFFMMLQNYIQYPLYFYGSFLRTDYFPGKSDIDIDIFSENATSTIVLLSHFLNIKKEKFKKVVWRLNHNNKVVYGHKIMYKNEELNLLCEISVYNEKFKRDVLYEHNLKINLPFYARWILILLKFFYYELGLLNKETFVYLKKKIMSLGIGLPNDDFVSL
jgi:predicted nucleotidyltransferase